MTKLKTIIEFTILLATLALIIYVIIRYDRMITVSTSPEPTMTVDKDGYVVIDGQPTLYTLEKVETFRLVKAGD